MRGQTNNFETNIKINEISKTYSLLEWNVYLFQTEFNKLYQYEIITSSRIESH